MIKIAKKQLKDWRKYRGKTKEEMVYKETKLKDFSIGRGKAKATFKNVKRIKKGLMPRYYEINVYGKRGTMIYRNVQIHAKNKEDLRKGLKKMFPLKVRKNLI